jgi:hypothetical protein
LRFHLCMGAPKQRRRPCNAGSIAPATMRRVRKGPRIGTSFPDWGMPELGQPRTPSLGTARPLPPSADIGPGGHSDGQAAQARFGRLTSGCPSECGVVSSSKSRRSRCR